MDQTQCGYILTQAGFAAVNVAEHSNVDVVHPMCFCHSRAHCLAIAVC